LESEDILTVRCIRDVDGTEDERKSDLLESSADEEVRRRAFEREVRRGGSACRRLKGELEDPDDDLFGLEEAKEKERSVSERRRSGTDSQPTG